MKKQFCLMFIACLFCACQNKTSSNQKTPTPKPAEEIKLAEEKISEVNQETKSIEPETIDSETKNLAELFLEDESQYSSQFVSKIRSFGGVKRIDLKGDFVLLDQKDTIQFPTIPKVNKSYTLTGKDGDLAIALTVKRINYTTLDYKIEIKELGKASQSETGQAELSPFFFLGSESDTDDATKESYFCTEFSVAKEPCHLSIRIGNMEDSPEHALLGKLIKNCNGEIRDIDLDNFPTLREK